MFVFHYVVDIIGLEAGPLFGRSGAFVKVVVGGFDDLIIVPGVHVGVVGPGLDAADKTGGVHAAGQHGVDDLHGLGAADGLVGLEGAVGIAVDPAVRHGGGDILIRPVG